MFLGLEGQKGLGLNINENKVSATDHVKLLGLEIDNKLKFINRVKTLCSKVNKKINTFSRLNTFICREQALKICYAVILSHFNFCPLIWLFCNKSVYKEVDRTHKRALRILYKDCGLKGQKGLGLNINENKVSATDHVKLLGIEIDNKLKFSNRLKTLCSKVNKKNQHLF